MGLECCLFTLLGEIPGYFSASSTSFKPAILTTQRKLIPIIYTMHSRL
jgi:hypothetical protein